MWKDIKGYKGYYQVDECGNVRSLDRLVYSPLHGKVKRKGKTRPLVESQDGYMMVKLSKNGKTKRYSVHKLVALHFCNGYHDGLEVNHIDFNRKNNYYKNLEWITHKDNVLHSHKNGNYKKPQYFGEGNPNYSNDTLKNYYRDNPDEKLKLARHGSKNGTARAVKIIDLDMEFTYLGECAQYLIKNNYTKATHVSSVSDGIVLSIKDHRKYLGLRFIFI